MRGDRIFGLAMMIIALGYILSATTIRTSFMSDPVGPRIFPYIIGGLTMLCAVSMVLRPDPDSDW
ncbi:tripartite tricarboxylate transporter TctB family protein, partial [Pseudorhodobacter sp.]|uniref:tripartite tricarboxylate transporter TctB family protein n=1 Tax=Pseudorhodobacter sp. TaxID=1934400 RepID=UPI00264AEAAF|nr:tripartite tricarboxylate transporter TctB family protein [Pseudorhodobacter sp.]